MALLLLSVASSARGDDLTSRIDALLAKWDRPGSPGVALAVVRNGELHYAKGYGVADLEHDVPITSKTPFYIASVTKQFTAFAIAHLAREGKLSLDDDIRKHIPELKDLRAEITIRQLLHHTSGLRDYGGLLVLSGGRGGDVIRQDDILGLLFRQRELNFRPGEDHAYCNSNYILLATIVERVTKQSYRDWMVKNVFVPLDMTQSDVGDDLGRIIKGRALSYDTQPSEPAGFKTLSWPITAYGDGNIYASAEDLARWLTNFGKPRVGAEATLRQMEEPGTLKAGTPVAYGFGLGVGEYRGLKLIGHGGGWAGYRAYVGRFPEQDLGIVVLSNHGSFDAQDVAMKVAELYLDGKLASSTSKAPETTTSTSRRIEQFAPDAKDLSACAGLYYSPELDASYLLVVKDGTLVLKTPRHADIILKPIASDHYTGLVLGSLQEDLRFHRDAEGPITAFRISLLGARSLRFDRRD
jgi:CubicO group peptidase (beta-lactamase class C family)